MHEPTPGRPRHHRGSKLIGALLYGGTAIAAVAAPLASRRLRRRLPAPVADTVVLAGLVASGWAAIAVLERLRPFDPDWNRSRGDGATDLGHLVISDSLGQIASQVITTPIRRARAEAGPGRGLALLPLPLRLAAILLAYDLGHSLLHRLLHENGKLWPFHAVHHSPERLYWGNASRFHPVEMAADGTQEIIALAVLGADNETMLAYRVFRGIFGQIQHANIDLDSGPLNAVLSTPERHRWHHSTDPAEGNTNYGAVLSVWDRVFGTNFLPERDFDAEIGNGDPNYPTEWASQVAAPFN